MMLGVTFKLYLDSRKNFWYWFEFPPLARMATGRRYWRKKVFTGSRPGSLFSVVITRVAIKMEILFPPSAAKQAMKAAISASNRLPKHRQAESA